MAKRLTKARGHAELTEGVASMVALIGALSTGACLLAGMGGDEGLLGVALVSFVASSVAWAILRAAALSLHLRVDRALLAGMD